MLRPGRILERVLSEWDGSHVVWCGPQHHRTTSESVGPTLRHCAQPDGCFLSESESAVAPRGEYSALISWERRAAGIKETDEDLSRGRPRRSILGRKDSDAPRKALRR